MTYLPVKKMYTVVALGHHTETERRYYYDSEL